MTRLRDLGPGEILDRLTILALKIVHGRLKGIPVTHWEEERRALEGRLAAAFPLTATTDPMELAAVNAALWQAEDEMRRLRQIIQAYEAWTGEAARCGMQIQQLNDRRAVLITLINANAGLDRPSDKV